MKRNYITPVTEQITIKLERHLLNLSFDDTPADPGSAPAKPHILLEDDNNDQLDINSTGVVSIGKHSVWDD